MYINLKNILKSNIKHQKIFFFLRIFSTTIHLAWMGPCWSVPASVLNLLKPPELRWTRVWSLKRSIKYLCLKLTQPIFWRSNQHLQENKITQLSKASSSPNIQNEIDNSYLQNLDKSVNWKNFSKVLGYFIFETYNEILG